MNNEQQLLHNICPLVLFHYIKCLQQVICMKLMKIINNNFY
jgi:hypothetical protein